MPDEWSQYAETATPADEWAQYAVPSHASAASPISPPGVQRPAVNMKEQYLLGGDKEPASRAFGLDTLSQDLGGMAKGLARNAGQVSTPGIAISLLQQRYPKVAGMLPKVLTRNAAPASELPSTIAQTALPMIVGGMVEPQPIPSPRMQPEAPAPSAPSPAGTLATKLAMKLLKRRVPGLGLAMDVNDFAQELSKPQAVPKPTASPVQFAADGTPLGKPILKQGTDAVVDTKVPPTADPVANARTKAQIDFHLKQGNVDGAIDALKKAAQDHANSEPPPGFNEDLRAKNAAERQQERDQQYSQRLDSRTNPGGKLPSQAPKGPEPGPPRSPRSDFPPPAPTNPGSTADIRANLPEALARARADKLNDRSISQEMNQNLEQHGRMAESEARKEFIARNSTGTTKGDLVRAAGGTVSDQPVKYTKTPGVKMPADLTDILKKSLDAAKRRKPPAP